MSTKTNNERQHLVFLTILNRMTDLVDLSLRKAKAQTGSQFQFPRTCVSFRATVFRRLWVCATSLNLQASIRQKAGRVWGSKDITDLGRPKTPRKEGADGIEFESSTKMSNFGTRLVVTPAFDGEDQLSPRANAPMADSVLSSISKSSSLREGPLMSSILINMDGDMTAKVKLADVRKQLMTMGLFPPDLYGIGESFHEMRQRYLPTRFISMSAAIVLDDD